MTRLQPPTDGAGRERRRQWLRDLLLCLLLVSVTLLAYHRAAGHGFLGFDDPLYVTENEQVVAGLTAAGLAWTFSFSGGERTYWHPATWLSHMVDCELFGLDPTMHHVVNIGLHAANAVLLYLFFARATGTRWPSALVAAVFALHPINVESVAWIAERKNLLSTLLWLLTMVAWAAYCRRPGFARYALALALFATGLLAKPMLVTLPFVLLLLDFWPLDRVAALARQPSPGSAQRTPGPAPPRVSATRAVAEKLPFVALSLASVLLSPLSVRAAGIVMPHETVPLGLRLANAVVSYLAYLGKILAPRDLAVFYPYPAAIAAWKTVAAAAVLLTVTAVAWRWWPRRPYLLVGWLWFVGTLVPVSGILQAGLWPALADRWAYVPHIGITLMIAWGAAEIALRHAIRPRILAACALATLAALLAGTMVQVEHWQSTVALFEHATLVTADNHVAHTNLGSALLDQGRLSEAMVHLDLALRLRPDSAHAHNALGIALARRGDLRSALGHFRAAVAEKPDLAEARANLERAEALLGGQPGAAISAEHGF